MNLLHQSLPIVVVIVMNVSGAKRAGYETFRVGGVLGDKRGRCRARRLLANGAVGEGGALGVVDGVRDDLLDLLGQTLLERLRHDGLAGLRER